MAPCTARPPALRHRVHDAGDRRTPSAGQRQLEIQRLRDVDAGRHGPMATVQGPAAKQRQTARSRKQRNPRRNNGKALLLLSVMLSVVSPAVPRVSAVIRSSDVWRIIDQPRPLLYIAPAPRDHCLAVIVLQRIRVCRFV